MGQSWIKVEMDARDAMRDLRGIKREQFPFAYAAALTETAKLAQTAVQVKTRLSFNLHTEYIPRGIRITPAKKRDVVQMGMAWSSVYTSDAITSFMVIHEEGGIKDPRGKVLSVPTTGIRQYSFKTARGAVKKRWQPKGLLRGYTGRTGTRKRKKGRLSRQAFILPKKGAQPAMLVRRVSRGERGLELLYVFTPQARIEPRWGFEDTVQRTADKVFKRVFDDKFKMALRSAK